MDGLGEGGVGDLIDEFSQLVGNNEGSTKSPENQIASTATDSNQHGLDYSSMAWITSGFIATFLVLLFAFLAIKGFIAKRRVQPIPQDDDCDIPFEKIF